MFDFFSGAVEKAKSVGSSLATQYEHAQQMMMTTSGRRQITNLSNNVMRDDANAPRLDDDGNEIHHQVAITPYFMDSVADGEHTWANIRRDNARADKHDYDESFRESDGSRGEGSDVSIDYIPGLQIDNTSGDLCLAHEMEHAWHDTQGTLASGEYDNGGGRTTRNAERQAVGLTRSDISPWADPWGAPENQYRWERNELGDQWLPRPDYKTYPGAEPDAGKRQQAWDAYFLSGNDAVPWNRTG